jgi:hypothetical protein
MTNEPYERYINCQHARDLPRIMLSIVHCVFDGRAYRVVCCNECKARLGAKEESNATSDIQQL